MRSSTDQVASADLQQIEAAKTAAAAPITGAGAWSAERLREASTEASNAVIERIRRETEKTQQASRTALRAAWATVAIAVLAVAGMAGFWFAGLGHG